MMTVVIGLQGVGTAATYIGTLLYMMKGQLEGKVRLLYSFQEKSQAFQTCIELRAGKTPFPFKFRLFPRKIYNNYSCLKVSLPWSQPD